MIVTFKSSYSAPNRVWPIVDLSYRLNLFGFPNTPTLGHNISNPSLRDQHLAVRWVHDKICSFGGDPFRMVLAGQSAGSASIATYLYAYPDDPIAAGAIMMSGQVAIVGTNDYSEYERVAGVVGCRNQADRRKELDCMKLVDTFHLKQAISNASFNKFAANNGGMPRYDNTTVFHSRPYSAKG